MNSYRFSVLLIFSCFFHNICCASETLMNMKIGPLWPHELQNTKKPTAWEASLQIGKIIDRKIAIGTGIDFLWNRYMEEERVEGSIYELKSKEKTLGFPLSAFLAITPFPDLIIYPSISGQIGLNTMYYSKSEDINSNNDDINDFDENGWYMGLIGKIAADALFNLGENSALFAGMEYQWSKPRKITKKRTDNLTAHRKMNGFGLRIGIRTIF